MNNLRFKLGTPVELEGVPGTSVIESICEAKRFCIEHKLPEVSLTCNGFEFTIDSTTDVLDEIKQYFNSTILFGNAAFIEMSFRDIIAQCNQTTSGNVSHKVMAIKGIVSNAMEMITKNID